MWIEIYFLMYGLEHIKPSNILQILCHYIPEESFFFFFNLLLRRKSIFESASSLFMRFALYAWHCQPLARAAFPPRGKNPDSHWIEGWNCPIPGLDVLQKKSPLPLQGFEPWIVQPATYSLYWLRLLYVYSILQRRSSERCIFACVSFLHNILLTWHYALWLRVQRRGWVTAGCWFSQLWRLPYRRKIDH